MCYKDSSNIYDLLIDDFDRYGWYVTSYEDLMMKPFMRMPTWYAHTSNGIIGFFTLLQPPLYVFQISKHNYINLVLFLLIFD